ncbi:hypothetical protein FRB98_003202, partial [Tulasnella sp. 332]
MSEAEEDIVDANTGAPIQIAAEAMELVRQQIEVLVVYDTLQQRDKEMKARYSNRFPSDIPHTDSLPTDVYL